MHVVCSLQKLEMYLFVYHLRLLPPVKCVAQAHRPPRAQEMSANTIFVVFKIINTVFKEKLTFDKQLWTERQSVF